MKSHKQNQSTRKPKKAAKRKSAVKSNSVLNAVRTWLDKQGFPLEMRTASAFRAAGFDVRQSSYYVDPETGKGREIDVLAYHPDPVMLGVTKIMFVIECKTSDKPWLLLQSADTLVGYLRYRAFSVLSDAALTTMLHHSEWIETLPWLKKPPLAGYAFRQAFGEKDVAYSAAITVAKACENLVGPQDDQFPTFTLVFPIIVVDSPLISCNIRKDGTLQLKRIKSGEFLFLAKLQKHFGSCIRVVTVNALEDFAIEAGQAANQFRAAFKPEEARLIKSWKQNNTDLASA